MRRTIPRMAVLVVLSAGFVSCKGGSAARSSVSSAESPTQQIVLAPVTTVRGVGDSIDLAYVLPTRSSQGMLAVPIAMNAGDAVALYDSTGRFRQRIGRGGRGPGEFQRIEGVAFGPGDTLWVSERQRVHVFSPPPRNAFVRTVQRDHNVGQGTPYGMLSRGVMTSNGLVPARVLAWDGQTVREFGANAPTKPADNRMGAVGLADSTHAWVAYPNAYRLDLLGTDGAVHQSVERRVAWFSSDRAERQQLWREQRMPPIIQAVGVDNAARLWVAIRRGNPDRKPPTRPASSVAARPAGNGGRPTPDRMASDWLGTLEVIDPATSDLIATRPIGGGVLGFLGTDLLYEVTADSLGTVSGHLWRFSLTPK